MRRIPPSGLLESLHTRLWHVSNSKRPLAISRALPSFGTRPTNSNVSLTSRRFLQTTETETPRKIFTGPGGFQFDPRKPFDTKAWNAQTYLLVGVLLGGGIYYVIHLERVPETGRWRFMDMSASRERRLAEEATAELTQQFQGKILPADHPLTIHIRGIVERLLEASDLGTVVGSEPAPGGVFSQHPSEMNRPPSPSIPSSGGDTGDAGGESSAEEAIWDPDNGRGVQADATSSSGRLGRRKVASVESGGERSREWTLMVVDAPIVNAMASFGNIVVFTGLVPVAQTDEGVAAVLAHEIGHVVARHNSERVSSQKLILLAVTIADTVLDTFFGLNIGVSLSNIVAHIVFELPNSRKQELEADLIGLRIAAKACYDPQEVPDMLARLGEFENQQSRARGRKFNLKFLQTHPASDVRVQTLTAQLPLAYQLQNESSACTGMQDALRDFGKARRFSFARG